MKIKEYVAQKMSRALRSGFMILIVLVMIFISVGCTKKKEAAKSVTYGFEEHAVAAVYQNYNNKKNRLGI